MNHIIELVMAAGKCFHYHSDCGKIALFCNKNYTPIHFLPRGPAPLHLTTLSPTQEIMTRWKKKNQKKESFKERMTNYLLFTENKVEVRFLTFFFSHQRN